MTFSQNLNPTFPKQPLTSRVNIVNADAQTLKTAYTAGTSGSKINGIVATSTDTSARDIQVSISNGGTAYVLVTKTVPITAGTVAGTATTNLLDTGLVVGLPNDSDANPYFYLISGDTLTVSALTTVTTAKTITVHVFGSDF